MSLDALKACQPMIWYSNHYKSEPLNLEVSQLNPSMVTDARIRFLRYAPLLKNLFPEAFIGAGVVESPLMDATAYFHQMRLEGAGKEHILLKLDSELPIAGSIKARGGIYEVLLHTEEIFSELGYTDPIETIVHMPLEALRQQLSHYTILVGSTGNLGLSIGMMSAKLGYRVEVHMSKDAKAWKKDLLKYHGAQVVEHQGDYSMAVDAARGKSVSLHNAYFIDDENSKALFMGYASAAIELKEQLSDLSIEIDQMKRLAVVIPCGVGGAPGGICYGLKTVFGEDVDVFFVEPTQAPCMALGLMTGLHDQVSIEDYGIELNTIADGLAVGRPSKFAGQAIEKMICGVLTVEDQQMIKDVRSLYEGLQVFVEPSSASALSTVARIDKNYSAMILWMTGGSLVPMAERLKFVGDGD